VTSSLGKVSAWYATHFLAPARFELGEREELLDEAADPLRLAVAHLEELRSCLGGVIFRSSVSA
jgi:hypothetical protein